MWLVDELLAAPQTAIRHTAVEIQRPGVVFERRIEPGVISWFTIATAQHGAHHGGDVFVPAVITHRTPAAVTVDLQNARAAVQTAGETDGSHLCTETDTKTVKLVFYRSHTLVYDQTATL